MIIQSLQIRNWRRLGEVDVNEFSPTLMVVHGPNGTGKTSMVGALRWTLVDLDHDTTRIAPVVPWGTNAVPEVTVGFSAGGERYVLTKRFTKRKEGGAELWRLSGDGGKRTQVATDKDATTKAREVIGVERSDRGIAQLLWVDQGSVGIPAVDEDLGNALRRTLGYVISGRDVAFRRALWERMKKDWFASEQSAAQGKLRKGSRLRELGEAIAKHEGAVTEIDAEFDKVRHLLADVDRRDSEIAEVDAGVVSASGEVAALRKADRDLADKRTRATELGGAVARLNEEFGRLQEGVRKYREEENAAAQLRQQVAAAEEQLGPLREALAGARKAVASAARARERAQRDAEDIANKQAITDAKRALVGIQERLAGAEKLLVKVEEFEEKIRKREETLARLEAPDRRQLGAIRKWVERLAELDAELQAAQLSLRIRSSKGGAVRLEIDGRAEEGVSLEPGRPLERAVRQHVEVAIGGFGTVEVLRGREDSNVEQLVAEHTKTVRDLSTAQERLGVADLARAEIVPELTGRMTRQAILEKELETLRNGLQEVAPDGRTALSGTMESLRQQRSRLVEAHPDLEGWVPSAASLEEAETAFGRLSKERWTVLNASRQEEDEATKRVGEAEKAVREADTQLQTVKADLARAEARRDSHTGEHGSETALAKAVESKADELRDAKLHFEKHRLTPDEERVPDELANAGKALEKRKERLSVLKQQLADLTGQLRSTEGLHARRVAGEQALESARREYDRLSVEVEAHRMLLMLFDEVRDESVGKSIKPVSDLVSGWLTELDGPGHHEPTFQSDLGVDGVSVGDAGKLDVDSATSYGEREQLGTLVRLAYGVVLAKDESQVVILDDPLAHADDFRHTRMLSVIRDAARRNLQIIIMTCHPERFDHLKDAVFFDLQQAAVSARGSG